MRADPEPNEDSIIFHAQGTPTETYAYRVNIESFVEFLELEGRMLRVFRPKSMNFPCLILHIGWKTFKGFPKSA